MATHGDLAWQETARRIELQMLNAGVRSATELARRTGVNRSTLSLKMGGVRRWRIADLRIIATELGTTVAYLIGETDDPRVAAVVPGQDPRLTLVPRDGIIRRANFLKVEIPTVIGEEGDNLLLRITDLEDIAEERNVPISYLTNFDDEDEADRVEALVEFSRTVAASGVQRIAARSLSALSANELRALARVIGKP